MVRLRRVVLTLLSVGALGVAAIAGSVVNAAAYAPGNNAVYQIGLSFNCQNHVTCVASPQNPFGIGGFWGWIELDNGCTGDAELTAQGHDNADPSLNGVFHFAIHDITWRTVPSPFGPTLLISAPELGPSPLGLPATAGHYQMSNGPGQMANIQVNQLRPSTC